MKKLIAIVSVALLFGYSAAKADTATIVVQPNTITNVLAGLAVTNGSFTINQVILTAGISNAAVYLVDSPDGTLTNTTPAYIGRFSYATNLIYITTNYYGVTNVLTNLCLIDYTNTVAATTVQRPIIAQLGALAGTSTILNNQSYQAGYGIFVTNTAANPPYAVTLSITYKRNF